MIRNYKIFLNDILSSMNHIESYVDNMDFKEFKKDQKTTN